MPALLHRAAITKPKIQRNICLAAMSLTVYILDRLDFVGHDIGQVSLLCMRTWECQTILFQRLLKYGVDDFKAL